MFKDYRVSDPSGCKVIQLGFFKWCYTILAETTEYNFSSAKCL